MTQDEAAVITNGTIVRFIWHGDRFVPQYLHGTKATVIGKSQYGKLIVTPHESCLEQMTVNPKYLKVVSSDQKERGENA